MFQCLHSSCTGEKARPCENTHCAPLFPLQINSDCVSKTSFGHLISPPRYFLLLFCLLSHLSLWRAASSQLVLVQHCYLYSTVSTACHRSVAWRKTALFFAPVLITQNTTVTVSYMSHMPSSQRSGAIFCANVCFSQTVSHCFQQPSWTWYIGLIILQWCVISKTSRKAELPFSPSHCSCSSWLNRLLLSHVNWSLFGSPPVRSTVACTPPLPPLMCTYGLQTGRRLYGMV